MSGNIFEYSWGIHPAEHKHLSTELPLENAPLPKRLVLPLQQHIGTPAEPLFGPGDQVLKGQKIAEASGFISVPVHAPTSGTIIEIAEHPIPHPSGLTDLCMVLEPDGNSRWCERTPLEDYQSLQPAELLEHIRDYGIAGLGGAGFPTAAKLGGGASADIEYLILNGVECEPYITADDTLMSEYPEDLLKGAEIIAHLVKPATILLGIEDNKPDAIDALNKAVKALNSPVEIVVIPTKYPSGGEKQLIQILTGREVPRGGIPADIGIVCVNVGTSAAVSKAVHQGEPLISRITTLTGRALETPRNLEVLLGTPIEHLLACCGVREDALSRLIMGGPMMGFTMTDPGLPVIKTTNCILAATGQELPAAPPAQPCIRCGLCAEACPAYLLPQQLYWYAKAKEFDRAESHHLFDCIECGACAYVCPSKIPLVQYFRFGKGEIRKAEHERIKAERSRERFEDRTERLAREEAEKEAKRKARREAAAKAAAEKKAAAERGEQAEDPRAKEVEAALARVQAKKEARQTADPTPGEDS